MYLKQLCFFLTALIGFIIGGKRIVNGAVYMALKLSLSQSTVGLTVVAVGNIPVGVGHLGQTLLELGQALKKQFGQFHMFLNQTF